MPIMFQTGRALSALGSLACATVLVATCVALSIAARTAAAAEATPSENSIEHQIQALVPSLEEYISANMKSFDVPGLAIGVVAGSKLVYAKDFGVRTKGGAPVDTQTLFQIGSVAKAFLSTTMAIAVDRGKLHWEDRIIDLDPEFQMRDPWVTREFRVFDLMAQRSGLPPYANEFLTVLGFDRSAQIRSLRYVDPVSSFLDGRRIVSPENLAYTRTPKVAMSDKAFYALGWVVQQTPNGDIVWHNGGTLGFGAMIALQLDRNLGVIVLSNQSNVGMPDALGLWTLDRLLGNPMVDHEAITIARAKATYADGVKQFARPADPQPSPPLAQLAGNFANPAFGKATLRMDGSTAALEIAATGAKLRLDPWNGPVYTATLAPDERFATMAASLGPLPIAFTQFLNDKDGKPTTLRLTFSDGQAYDFKRE
jgi:CubicO group peptidase (beta-lactamase class C family)